MSTSSDPQSPGSEPNSAAELELVSRAEGEPSKMDPSKMQIVPANYLNTNPFELPDGWVVEVRPRGPNSSVHSDKYYYEPGTGRKFRSLLSVKRHLTGVEEPSPRKRPFSNCLVPYQISGPFRRVAYGGKVLRLDELEEARSTSLKDIVPGTTQFQFSSTLPDGWIVEEIPRKDGFRSDRYYIEPVKGQKFRSIPEVHRFLEAQKYKPKCRALILSNRTTAPRSSAPRKKKTSVKMFNKVSVDLSNPPEKINWVYSGDGKDNWSPLVEECVLPNYVKEQWSETFLQGMNGSKHRVAQLTMGESNLGSNA